MVFGNRIGVAKPIHAKHRKNARKVVQKPGKRSGREGARGTQTESRGAT